MIALISLAREGPLTTRVNGGDMASTWVAKPEVHAEDTDSLVKKPVKLIVANDDNYALAA